MVLPNSKIDRRSGKQRGQRKLLALTLCLSLLMGLQLMFAAPSLAVSPVSQAQLDQAVLKATASLSNNQKTDGSIDNAGTSAWSAIAFGSAGIDSAAVAKQGITLVDYLKTYVPTPAPGGRATDFSRQILAALAAGEDPHGFGVDLISGLKAYHQGNQMGDPGLVNDDIFAVIALLGAGDDVSDAVVADSVAFVAAHQNADGGFSYSTTGSSDVDDTCAAIEALALARAKGYAGPADLNAALSSAKSFVLGSQKADGGFPYTPSGMFSTSNTATTAWAVQALTALGEDVSSIHTSSGSTPYHYLLSMQNADGSFSWTAGQPGQNLMTAYAVPALMGKPLPAIFNKIWCSGEAPGLSLNLEDVYWASYEDYLAGVLTVDFSIHNAAGGADAVNVQLVAAQNTNGVTALSVPQDLGSINTGDSHVFSMQYQLPQEAMGFKTMLFVTADDACGNQFAFPTAWAGPGMGLSGNAS